MKGQVNARNYIVPEMDKIKSVPLDTWGQL